MTYTRGQMKQARAEMEPQYRWLVQLLNAYALIDANEQRYAALIGALNQNIDYLKNVVLARQGWGQKPKESGRNGRSSLIFSKFETYFSASETSVLLAVCNFARQAAPV